jgi:glycosyltransferase involved in cell wall biosynthesis
MFACLVHRTEVEGHTLAAEVCHRVLDELQAAQDPLTGLWGSLESIALGRLIERANRIVECFGYVCRPLQRRTRVVDSVFVRHDPSAVPTSVEDTLQFAASVQVLCAFLETGYQRARLREVLLASDQTLRRLTPADPAAQIAATMATLSIARTGSGTSDIPSPTETPWPGLGVHRVAGTLTERDRSVLPLWMRALAIPGSRSPAPETAPAVSVIVPCYNLGRYLPEAIASVNAQTSQDLELIIVDDGSSDEFTQLLLAQWSKRGFRVVHQTNSGVATARNVGIRQSRGRYICCLDPDDAVTPVFFAKASQVLDSDAQVGIVSGWMRTFDEMEDVFRHEAPDPAALMAYNTIVEPAVFRRAAWDDVGGYTSTFSTPGIEDWDLALAIIERGYRAAILQEFVWEYRIHPRQMSDGLFDPDNYSRVCRELAERHLTSYRDNVLDVFFELSRFFAKLLRFSREQDRGVGWWRLQAASWSHTARERQKVIMQLRQWTEELTKARDWLESQLSGSQQLAAERQEQLDALRKWTDELAGGKDWLEVQTAQWRETAEQRERALASAIEDRERLAATVANLQPDAAQFRRLPQRVQNWLRRFNA